MTDQQHDENKLIAERRAKLTSIRENCRANGFPNEFRRENYAEELQAQFGEVEKDVKHYILRCDVVRQCAHEFEANCFRNFDEGKP